MGGWTEIAGKGWEAGGQEASSSIPSLALGLFPSLQPQQRRRIVMKLQPRSWLSALANYDCHAHEMMGSKGLLQEYLCRAQGFVGSI